MATTTPNYGLHVHDKTDEGDTFSDFVDNNNDDMQAIDTELHSLSGRKHARGAYDAIVYIQDGEVIAEDAEGDEIDSGDAGTDDADIIMSALGHKHILVSQDEYLISTPIIIPTRPYGAYYGRIIDFDNSVLKATAAIDHIIDTPTTSPVLNRIGNVVLDGDNKAVSCMRYSGDFCIYHDIFAKYATGDGISMRPASEAVSVNTITRNIQTHHNGGAGFVHGLVSDNFFENIFSFNNVGTGIDSYGAGFYGYNINSYWNGGSGVVLHNSYGRLTVVECYGNGLHGLYLTNNGTISSAYSNLITNVRACDNGQLGNGDGICICGGSGLGCSDNNISLVNIYDDGTPKTQRYGVNIGNCAGEKNNVIMQGIIGSMKTARVLISSPLKNMVYVPMSYITEASGSSTGTGSEQTIAHGLVAAPSKVVIVPTVTGATVSDMWADATNIYCTVTNGKAFNWSAEV